jgi:hypothetical protein
VAVVATGPCLTWVGWQALVVIWWELDENFVSVSRLFQVLLVSLGFLIFGIIFKLSQFLRKIYSGF